MNINSYTLHSWFTFRLVLFLILFCILFQRGEHVPVGVTVGDAVILPEYGGTKVEIDEKELYIYREHDILAKISKD